MWEAEGRTSRKRHLLGVCMVSALASTPSLAADVDQGKAIAIRWCATCHLVDRDQAMQQTRHHRSHPLRECPTSTKTSSRFSCYSRTRTCQGFR
jgi:hypothetical protein